MRKNAFKFFVSFSFFVTFLQGYGQHYASYMDVDYDQMFVEAESYFLYEDYEEAIFLYKKLINHYPNNHNLKFRLGVALLNVPYSKQEAVPLLEEAVDNTISLEQHKSNTLEETKAPEDAYYYLAKAYMINNQLKEALKFFNKAKNEFSPEEFNIEIINEEIEACKYAQKAMDHPVDVKFENMGSKINDAFPQFNAVISGDGKVLLFNSKLKFYDAVFFSRNVDGQWTKPVNIIPQLLVDGDCYPTSLSSDGTEAFFYRNDNYKGTICVSYFENNKWNEVEKLNRNINTKYWESHACVAEDDKKLYLTSNRKGGYGGLDIYVSSRDSVGAEWGDPVNLGNVINTQYDEDTPFFISGKNRLYFSSRGHQTMGGYDIFYADKNGENGWKIPKNIGYPINTTDDDLFYFPIDRGNSGLITRFIKGDTYGKKDIFIIDINSTQ